MEQNLIYCDECNAKFDTSGIEFKTAQTVIDNKQFKVVYYNCPTCGKVYVVCMLDYWGNKLQEKYISALDNYRKAYNEGISPIILQQKHAKVEALKEQAMAYQNELLHKYGDLLPEEIFI